MGFRSLAILQRRRWAVSVTDSWLILVSLLLHVLGARCASVCEARRTLHSAASRLLTAALLCKKKNNKKTKRCCLLCGSLPSPPVTLQERLQITVTWVPWLWLVLLSLKRAVLMWMHFPAAWSEAAHLRAKWQCDWSCGASDGLLSKIKHVVRTDWGCWAKLVSLRKNIKRCVFGVLLLSYFCVFMSVKVERMCLWQDVCVNSH